MFTLEKDLKEKQKETGMRVQMEFDYLFIKKIKKTPAYWKNKTQNTPIIWCWTQDRTDLVNGTHQRDETQGNNSTQALSTKVVFFRCKKIATQQKEKEAKKRTDKN